VAWPQSQSCDVQESSPLLSVRIPEYMLLQNRRMGAVIKASGKSHGLGAVR